MRSNQKRHDAPEKKPRFADEIGERYRYVSIAYRGSKVLGYHKKMHSKSHGRVFTDSECLSNFSIFRHYQQSNSGLQA